ncbi:MAG: carbamoyltransferase HypF [Saprospiraceae bacterium]
MSGPAAYHIHFRGQVQGVGFRPLVYRLAREGGWAGWISNGKDGVHLHLEGSREEIEFKVRSIQEQLPAYARIQETIITPSEGLSLGTFSIRDSEDQSATDLLLSPDRGICPTCRAEWRDPDNRRNQYPFITCLHCGPRYSIIRQLPYDRERTTMASFPLCPACAKEVQDPLDRRHYSQTNSCPDCAIPMAWEDGPTGRQEHDPQRIIDLATEALHAGQILAVKGLGGYLLLADARDQTVVETLRRCKHRPDKPLALMYPDHQALAKHVVLTDKARQLLEGPASPIVLLPWTDLARQELPLDRIAPGLSEIGVMLPSTPLFDQILQAFGHPVIATSGNISGSPILIHEEEARPGLAGIADHFLHNDRDMVAPQDDSVLRLAGPASDPILLRRSRGLAPAFLHNAFGRWQAEVLAMGAHMKGALAIQHGDTTHISQYLGNLESFEAQETYQQVTSQLLAILECTPGLILTDEHPGYFTTRWGQDLARQLGIPQQSFPHHLAHFAAVLAEHDRLADPEPVLGVIWDGTGLGADGTAWGGEYFLRADNQYRRLAFLQPYPLLLGDKMAREPRLAALALAYGHPEAEAILRPTFSAQEWSLYHRLLQDGQQMMTSSIGRLFDGVAALLGCCDRQSFEGQAAMYLETLAARSPDTSGYALNLGTEGAAWHSELIRCILADLHAGRPVSAIAAAFHRSLVDWIGQVASDARVRVIALSGGVWQNALLTRMVEEDLGSRLTILRHRQLAPNDENIPLGQLALLWQQQHDAYLPDSDPASNH